MPASIQFPATFHVFGSHGDNCAPPSAPFPAPNLPSGRVTVQFRHLTVHKNHSATRTRTESPVSSLANLESARIAPRADVERPTSRTVSNLWDQTVASVPTSAGQPGYPGWPDPP